MPIESILVVAGVLLVFSLFAAVLAWVDHSCSQGSGWHRTPAE
jgi:hypothetical protein